MVSVVDERVGPGPVNIVTRGLWCECPRSLVITQDAVSIDDVRIPLLESRWSSRPYVETTRADLQRHMATQMDFLRRHAPQKSLSWLFSVEPTAPASRFVSRYVDAVTQGVRLLFGGREAEGVRRLCGTGIGLTPSGDDFLVGHLAARHMLATMGNRRFALSLDTVTLHTRGTTLLSRTSLTLAAEGCFAAPVKDYVEALAHSDETALETHGHRLMGMGSTSGADLMTGLFLSLHQGLTT
ncbi:DUF2877 domain-containing protein [Candidatus Fermentibacteria bacterium]|nr:DUF2877 domain-containing protein [Candidatus Fermentibacteria bacterium]